MPKALYILIILFCTQLFAVGQDSDIDDLLDQAIELVSENPEKSIKLTQSAFKKASRSKDTYNMISAKSVMGYIGMVTNDYDASYINYTDALEYMNKYSVKDLYSRVSILNNLAIIKSSFGDHEGSASLYKMAHKAATQYVNENREIAEEDGDVEWLVDLPYEMAVELQDDGQYLEAGEVLVDLWEESEFKGDTILLAKVVNQLGLIKKRNGEFNKALDFFAIAAFNENVEPSLRAKLMHNLAATYTVQEDYVKASKYFAEALDLKLEHSNERSQFITMLDQGELKFIDGDLSAAITKWEQALGVYDVVKNEPDLFIIYDWLQKAYLNEDVKKSAFYGNLYSSNIRNWMDIQNNQIDSNASLQAFNTRIDTILSSRALKAERLELLRRYWPFAVIALLVIMLFVYMVQISLNKKREQVLERNLKVDRASVADEILNRIRRD